MAALLVGACAAGGLGAGSLVHRGRPYTELSTATLFAAAGARFGLAAVLPAYCLFFAALVTLAAIDVEQRLIPNRVLRPALALTVPLLGGAAIVDGAGQAALDALVGGALAFAALALVHLAQPRGLGFGDVRLGGFIGLYLGWLGLGEVVVGLVLGFLLAALAGLVLMAATGRGLMVRLPFAPFLGAGAVLAVLWGGPLARAWSG
ncbi:MAG TPA: A24 family peptidase [Acidimicrobiales bacterium]|nr:A24 family peptidase [Acidimicrobiales bacterium]